MTAFALLMAFGAGVGAYRTLESHPTAIVNSLMSARGWLVAGRRRRKLEADLAPVVRLLADSIDAGLTIPEAAARVGSGGGHASPALRSFASSCRRGLTVSEALARLTAGTNGDLWASVAFTVELHFRQGGDLGDSLRRVAEQLEARRYSQSSAQSTTAQARFTANIVCLMPLLAFAGGGLLFPSRVGMALTNPASLLLLTLGLGLQAGSLVAIRRISA